MKTQDAEARAKLEAAFRAVYSEAARTGEAIRRAILVAIWRYAKMAHKTRQAAARKATAAREENRADERAAWDRIDATLGNRPRSERARRIVAKLQAEDLPPFPTERAVYGYLTRKALAKKPRK